MEDWNGGKLGIENLKMKCTDYKIFSIVFYCAYCGSK
jgi:hypothetical protein